MSRKKDPIITATHSVQKRIMRAAALAASFDARVKAECIRPTRLPSVVPKPPGSSVMAPNMVANA